MIKIREMDFGDIDEVVKIEKENFSVPWDENGFFSFMIREGTVFVCAEEDGRITGYGGMVTAADQADITNISVSKDKRRSGTGTAIVEKLFEKGREMGIKEIFLEVRQSNAPAAALYEKLGFTEEGVRKNYYEAPVEDALIMKKEL
ncbi:MAG TPA: ribosomal protein S18-alanine N-acetyltransferase [Candidatus Alectryocaccobium stercorigallinarum]|nr:ribosomal protein S18-alanine N-acetyltransferase [Candidatus Alectryocaccobium stercorigallinarum]